MHVMTDQATEYEFAIVQKNMFRTVFEFGSIRKVVLRNCLLAGVGMINHRSIPRIRTILDVRKEMGIAGLSEFLQIEEFLGNEHRIIDDIRTEVRSGATYVFREKQS